MIKSFEVIGKIRDSYNYLVIHKQNNEIVHLIIISSVEFDNWKDDIIRQNGKKIK